MLRAHKKMPESREPGAGAPGGGRHPRPSQVGPLPTHTEPLPGYVSACTQLSRVFLFLSSRPGPTQPQPPARLHLPGRVLPIPSPLSPVTCPLQTEARGAAQVH